MQFADVACALKTQTAIKCKVPGRVRGSLWEGAGKAVRLCLREFIPNPSRENGIPERPQTLRYSEIINNFPLNMAKAHAAAIPSRPT